MLSNSNVIGRLVRSSTCDDIARAAQSQVAREGYVDDEGWLVLPNPSAYALFQPFSDVEGQLTDLRRLKPFPGVDLLVKSGYVTHIGSPDAVVIRGDEVRVREPGGWEYRVPLDRLAGFRVSAVPNG